MCSSLPEKPKELFVKDYRLSLLGCLIHLLPLGLTVYVLQLNYRSVYWADVITPNLNAKLNAFQFAAKLYEVLVNASLISILIYALKINLCNEGVPLGSLIASYEMNQISCLWTLAFWGGLFVSPSKSQWRHRLYGLILSILIIMAVIIGPMTAIAIIPKVDWWLQPVSVCNGLNTYWDHYGSPCLSTPYTAASTSQIWPNRLVDLNLPTQKCLSSNATKDFNCPAAGYSAILEYCQRAAFNDLQNVTIPGASQLEGPRFISCRPAERETTNLTVSSSISHQLARDIERAYLGSDSRAILLSTTPLWRLVGLNGSKPLKPVVQVECILSDPSTSTIEFPNSAFITPSFNLGKAPDIYTNGNIYTNESWTVDMDAVWNTSYLEEHVETNSVAFTWVDLEKYSRKPSIAAAVAIPLPFIPDRNDSIAQKHRSTMLACSFDARWLPAELWITPTLSDAYYESIPDPLQLLMSLQGSSMSLSKEPIDISLEWANALNLPITGSSLTTIETVLNATLDSEESDLYEPYLPDIFYNTPNIFGAVLAISLTDGLARVGLDFDVYTPYNDSLLECIACSGQFPISYCGLCSNGQYAAPSDLTEWTQWNLDYYQYGYGYGITNITSQIAAGVLILYAVIAVTAIITILVRNCNSNSWSSLGELLVLALNSPPSAALRNTGAGIDRLNTWKEVVRVRATEDEQLMMIFESGEDFDKCYDRKPKVGKKYK